MATFSGCICTNGGVLSYSVLRLLIGLARPALRARKLTVARAMTSAITPARANTHQLTGTRYA